uniref:Protein disulfide-isomerase n=1 Tax=Tityus melici TaxID=3026321 RepID=A0AA49QCI2_9SCOR|nr:putative disulfide isomerase [Tityus melici]
MFRVLAFISLLSLVICSDVLDLSGPDFDQRVAEHDTVLVEFFAPWCGHCKRLAPKYEEAATILKKNDPSVPLAKVDCTSDAGKESCSKYGVSGYPTLKIFRNGEFSSEYNGGRETDAIVKYMKSQVGPSSVEIKTLSDAKKLLSRIEVVIIGFFKNEKSQLKEEFLKVADKLRETTSFGHSSNQEVLDSYGYKDQIVLFRPQHLQSKFEEKELKYEGGADKSKIEDFIRDNFHGLVGHRTNDNFQDFKNPLIVAYYDVDYVKNTKGTNYWRNRIMKVAQNYKDKLNFAISNVNQFSAEVEEFGLSVKGDKPVIAARSEKQQKFRMTDEFSMDTFEKFLKDFLDGKLEAHIKSEPVPENNDGPVKVAVASNFDSLVMDNDKDILLEFYAPWCGHCKKLAPTYEELGTEMKDEEVDIIKMDATANDVPPPYEVHGFPTLYWVPKNGKNSPKKYDGGRELDDFIKYVSKHATNELKGWDRKGTKKSGKTEL